MNEDWIDVLREAAVSEDAGGLPEGLWERISTGLGAAKPRLAVRRRRLYAWAASVATIAAAAAAAIVFMPSNPVSDSVGGSELLAGITTINENQNGQSAVTAEPEPAGNGFEAAETVSGRTAATPRRVSGADSEPQPLPVQSGGTAYERAENKTPVPAGDPDRNAPDGSGREQRGENTQSVDVTPRTYKSDAPRSKKSAARRVMLALSGNGDVSGSSASPGTSATLRRSAMMLTYNREGLMLVDTPPEKYSYRHRQPLTFALSFDLNVGHNLFVGAGVSYTKLSSRVSAEVSNRQFNQSLQYVGIPVSFKWAFLNTRYFMLYTGAEVQPEFCVDARFDGKKADAKTMQWSVHAVAGAQLNLGRHFGIYAEPKLSHYFADAGLETVRNTGGVNFNLQFGLRLSY